MAHAVMELIEEISNAIDKKTHAIGVFIDLKEGLRLKNICSDITAFHTNVLQVSYVICVCSEITAFTYKCRTRVLHDVCLQ